MFRFYSRSLFAFMNQRIKRTGGDDIAKKKERDGRHGFERDSSDYIQTAPDGRGQDEKKIGFVPVFSCCYRHNFHV